MRLTRFMDVGQLAALFIFCNVIEDHLANAHRSSGRLIIDTAKKAFERAARRHKRDTSASSEITLESLLLPKENKDRLVEFDLIMDEDQFGTVQSFGENDKKLLQNSNRPKRKAVRHSIYHWPGAVVPYEIHSSVDTVSSLARYRIQKAMKHWEKHTCVKFVKYNPYKHSNYVTIQKGQWCASKLGMAGGPQPLYVAFGCLDTGTIIHELGHSLGWVHEQARPDRDAYVSINWSLVSPSYKSQYVKHGTDFVNTFGIPYDYGSIMHYPSYGELITKDPAAQNKIGQRNRLSFLDVKLANTMYKCAERAGCDTYKRECKNGGFLDHTCKCVCPDGNYKSCTVINSIFRPYPVIKRATTTPRLEVCDPWTVYDNAYIPGYNEDVGFSLTIEQCQTRCMREKNFKCRSFDYWKARRQCYLSSSTATGLGIRLRRDSRMVHYMLADCRVPKPVTTTISTTTDYTRSTRKVDLVKPTKVKPTKNICPFEYANTGHSCVRAFSFPIRPVHIAEMECNRKLGAKLWVMSKNELRATTLAPLINEGEEFWIKIENFRSKNMMVNFFDFCPYITKVKGVVMLKDTLCYKSKGFICQL